VVVEVGVGDGHPLAGVGDIAKTVIIVLVVSQIGGQVAVINPDILGVLDSDRITVVGQNLADLEVAHNDVGLILDVESDTSQGYQ
jgi:hypothetical protein